MGIVYTPKEPHRCKPHTDGAPRVRGMVWRCDECGSRWMLWGSDANLPGWDDLGWHWYPEGPISKIRRWWRSRRVQR